MSVLAEILNCSSNSNNLSGVVSVSDAEDFCRIMLSFLLKPAWMVSFPGLSMPLTRKRLMSSWRVLDSSLAV